MTMRSAHACSVVLIAVKRSLMTAFSLLAL